VCVEEADVLIRYALRALKICTYVEAYIRELDPSVLDVRKYALGLLECAAGLKALIDDH
jgi:hypothetical protein